MESLCPLAQRAAYLKSHATEQETRPSRQQRHLPAGGAGRQHRLQRDALARRQRARTINRSIYSAVLILIHLALSYLLLRHIQRRKVAEDQLSNSERKFSSMFKLSPLPMAVLNMNCRCFVDANHTMLKQFRYTSGVFRAPEFYRESLWRDPQVQQAFEERLARVCDPFFTTKLSQGGSGLGMHIVYNLVNNLLGGTLQIESPAGKGIKIIITLPLRAPQGSEQAGPSAPPNYQPPPRLVRGDY